MLRPDPIPRFGVPRRMHTTQPQPGPAAHPTARVRGRRASPWWYLRYWALVSLPAMLIAAVPPSPAQRHAIDYRVGDVQVCGAIDEFALLPSERCADRRREFASGEAACVFTRFDSPASVQAHKVVAYRDGVEQFERLSLNHGPGTWHVGEGGWAYCEPDLAVPGHWRFELYVDIGVGFELVGSRSLRVQTEQPYAFAGAETCSRVVTSVDGWSYACAEPADTFVAPERVHLVAEFADVVVDHRFRVVTRRDGALVRTQTTDWNRVRERWARSYFVPDVETTPGTYTFEFFIDVGDGFEPVGTRTFAAALLAPVEGPVRAQCHWPDEHGVWAFCKHGPGGPHAPHGVALSDDSQAWDANLRDYADSGEWVYPVAPGRVVRYGGADAGPYNGAAGILVQHETRHGEVWWSGYLHMRRDSITVREGDLVDVYTPLGRIGRTGTTNSHLHVVAYRGDNDKRGLRSFDAEIRGRDTVVTARRPGGRDRAG